MIEALIAILISLAAFAVLLPLIVFVHEYGHFKVARLCGIRVDAFSIGFGPALVSWMDKKGTRWKISAIPLGGYVKFFGDANAASAGASADNADGAASEKAGQPPTTQFNSEKDKLAALLTPEEKKVCFHFKPIWQRAAVVAAGPAANFVLALVIFATIYMTIGQRIDQAVIGRVVPESAAAEAGFEPGDMILKINGAKVADFDDLAMRVRLSAGTERAFVVRRNGTERTLLATPKRVEQTDPFGNPVSQGQLGIEGFIEPKIGGFTDDSTAKVSGLQIGDTIISVAGEPVFTFSDATRAVENRAGEEVVVVVARAGREKTFQVPVKTVSVVDAESQKSVTFGSLGFGGDRTPLERLGPIAAIATGADQIRRVVTGTLSYLGRLVRLQEDPRQLGGPIKIAKYAGQAVSIGFDEEIEAGFGKRILISLTTFVQLAALISVSIGLLNLLPVPVLDGGHLVYYAYEAVVGRPLSDRVQGIGFRIGMALVGSLMVFVVVNDVLQLF